MDDKTKLDDQNGESEEKEVIRASSSSSSSDYELVDNESNTEKDDSKKQTTPVLENIVSEDLIFDSMCSTSLIKSPSSNNVLVGKSIFYDCREKEEAASDTDDGETHTRTPKFFFTIFSSTLHRCTHLRDRSRLQK
jgi:hypothetical protein